MTTVPILPTSTRASIRATDDGRVCHAVMPPHVAGRYTSTTAAGTIGISFSGHRRAVVERDGRVDVLTIPPGAALRFTGSPVAWLEVAEPSEALEIDLSSMLDAPDPFADRPVTAIADRGPHRDDALWSTAIVLRAALVEGRAIDPLWLDERLRALAARLTHAPASRAATRLSFERRARVVDYIDAHLDEPLSLDVLAAVACWSRFHFARAFAAATGLAPHRFVIARRMQAARDRLVASDAPVEAIANAVGYRSLPHFRDAFVRHHGIAPSRLRAALRGLR